MNAPFKSKFRRGSEDDPEYQALLAQTAPLEAADKVLRNAFYGWLRRVYPTVKMWVSPSAIELFWLCRRKWAFQYIERSPRDNSVSKMLGTVVHKERENWLIHGISPSDTKAGALAKCGLETLPPPGFAQVEQTLAIPTLWGWGFTGKIDFGIDNLDPRRLWGTYGIPMAGDHKTTTSEDYIKDEETLATKDPQGTLYGVATFLRLPVYATEVDLHWSYILKAKTPKPKQVRVRVSREQLSRNLPVLHDTACEMLTLKSTPGIKANDVPGNPQACDAFGGCKYRDRCSLPAVDRLRSAFTQVSDPWIPAHHPGGYR